MSNDASTNVVNAELHALIQDTYESEDVADRTLGYILIRQVVHLDGPELVTRMKEISRALITALTKFDQQLKTIVEEQMADDR